MEARTFLTVVLAAVVAYFAYQKYSSGRQQEMFQERLANYAESKQENMAKLKEHSNEFNKPEVIKVTDGVYVAVGYAIANSILVEAPEGAIIIDTLESMTGAEEVYAAFRQITKSPVKAIIYTHNHGDHIAGAKAFLQDTQGQHIDIWAHHTLTSLVKFTHSTMNRATFTRAMRQFGPLLPKQENAGIGYRLRLNDPEKINYGFVAPNKFLVEDSASVNIAGLDLQLIHIPGETDDQIAVWYPGKQVMFCADDFYKAFPNLYAIRGTPFRSLAKWVESIDKMRKLRPQFLVPSHTRPVTGSETIFNLLRDYRDAIQYVHDQTVRHINRDVHPDDIANMVQLPKALASNPYLQEFYGTVPWSVRGLYSGYIGWFSGDPVDLNPYSTLERSKRLVQLGGGEAKVLATAQKALDSNDPQWALELSSAAVRVNPDSELAKELKVKSLIDLSYTQISANGNNFYQTCAFEAMGKLKIMPPVAMRRQAIYRTPPRELLHLLSIRLKGEECSEMDKSVVFNFTDTGTIACFHMRHGIWDLNPDLPDPAKADLILTTTLDVWRQVIAKDKSGVGAYAAGEIELKGNVMDFKNVFGCIEGDE